MDLEEVFLAFDSLPLVASPALFAEKSGVSLHVVKHWIADGLIPTHEIGRRKFINIPKLRQELLKDKVQKRILSSAPRRNKR